MTILEALVQLRDDIKTWCTNNITNINTIINTHKSDSGHITADERIKWDAAKTNADTARNTANTAASLASTADTNASEAKSTAATASANASTAINTANEAKSTAADASSTASTANTNANTAKDTAASALNVANSASSTATTANTNAIAAQNTATNALNAANSKVGKSVAGQTFAYLRFKPETDSNIPETKTADNGAEVFNHYDGNQTLIDQKNVAIGYCAHAEGSSTLAIGKASHAEGVQTQAFGDYSHAEGWETIANDYQHASGKYNKSTTAPSLWNSQDTNHNDAIFLIGYGKGRSNAERANAFRVSSGGRCHGAMAFVGSGADFAELFEWADGNPDNEDRRGLFVTLDGDKIKLANADDDYIGVISGAQAFIGNSASEDWHGKYLTDVFGTRISQEIEIPEKIDEITGKIIPAHTTTQYVINPDYDPNEPYIMRENRKEWGTVGLLGQVVVIDDGTCKVGGYVKPSANGIGTASDGGYRVMKRVDDNHIKVLVK